MIPNWRNQAKRYEHLLLSVCKRLEEYGIEMPRDAGNWWLARKNLAMIRKVNRSEMFGELQTLMDEAEAREAREQDFT